MIITKNDIIIEAFSKLKISGVTTVATPEDTHMALRRLAGIVGALQVDIGYIYPSQIGDDDPSDDSGISIDAFDPLSTILAYSLAPDFGKEYSPLEKINADNKLCQLYTEIEGSKYPTTLPVGIANETYTDREFYDGEQPLENKTYSVELP